MKVIPFKSGSGPNFEADDMARQFVEGSKVAAQACIYR